MDRNVKFPMLYSETFLIPVYQGYETKVADADYGTRRVMRTVYGGTKYYFIKMRRESMWEDIAVNMHL